MIRFQQLEDGMARQAAAFGVQRRGAAVNVVVAHASRGQLELSEAKAGSCEKREKLLRVRGCSHQQ
jgi:hypothetical protein